MKTKTKPWFDSAVLETLTETQRILKLRGEIYGDSWADPTTFFTDHTNRVLGTKQTKDAKRARLLAGMIDVKLNRVPDSAEFLEDTPDDLINYLAAWKVAVRSAL